ncbi:MAG: universal stress protein [Proteobacteria bacterium]|nr:universal stress protein [Pseudomonadota bacterium]
MFKKILFATTIETDCDDAAMYAFDVAKKFGATLHIFNVFGLPSHGYSRDVINRKTGEKETYSEEYDASVIEDIKETYAEQLEQYENCKIDCTIGVPDTEISRKVRKEGIDLIIMGAHHQTQDPEAIRYRNVAGDTLQKVAKGARCPVIIVSRPYDRHFGDIRNILVGTDLTRASLPAFRFALRLAKHGQSSLHLCHAVDVSGKEPGRIPTQAEVESLIQEADNKLKETYPPEMEGHEDYTTTVSEGIPHVEILKCAREKNADLIVMAHHTGSIFKEKEVLGSTVEEVVLRSACPVASINRVNVLEGYTAFKS